MKTIGIQSSKKEQAPVCKYVWNLYCIPFVPSSKQNLPNSFASCILQCAQTFLPSAFGQRGRAVDPTFSSVPYKFIFYNQSKYIYIKEPREINQCNTTKKEISRRLEMLLELCRKDTQEKRVIFWMQMWFIVLINCYSIMQNLRFRRKKILRRLWTLLSIFLLNRSIFLKISLQYNWHVTLVSDAQHIDLIFVWIVSWWAQLLLPLLSRCSRAQLCVTQ